MRRAPDPDRRPAASHGCRSGAGASPASRPIPVERSEARGGPRAWTDGRPCVTLSRSMTGDPGVWATAEGRETSSDMIRPQDRSHGLGRLARPPPAMAFGPRGAGASCDARCPLNTGAGDEIRTHDPNLGKVARHPVTSSDCWKLRLGLSPDFAICSAVSVRKLCGPLARALETSCAAAGIPSHGGAIIERDNTPCAKHSAGRVLWKPEITDRKIKMRVRRSAAAPRTPCVVLGTVFFARAIPQTRRTPLDPEACGPKGRVVRGGNRGSPRAVLKARLRPGAGPHPGRVRLLLALSRSSTIETPPARESATGDRLSGRFA